MCDQDHFEKDRQEFEALGPFAGFFHPEIGHGADTGGTTGTPGMLPVGDQQLAAAPA